MIIVTGLHTLERIYNKAAKLTIYATILFPGILRSCAQFCEILEGFLAETVNVISVMPYNVSLKFLMPDC